LVIPKQPAAGIWCLRRAD